MAPLADFGITVSSRDYHGSVFRIEEIADVVERHGLPHGAGPDTYEGHQVANFEHYIEVQVWSDDALHTITR